MRSLVVDDEFVALHKMIGLLSPLGACDAATHGQQAIEMFHAALAGDRPYDLVTIDIEMPVMSGIAVLRRLQLEEQIAQRTPATKIMITAAANPANVSAACSSHCQGFLVKPVRRAVLMEKLASLGLLPAPAAPSPSERWPAVGLGGKVSSQALAGETHGPADPAGGVPHAPRA